MSLITPRNYARRLLNPLRRRAPDKKRRRKWLMTRRLSLASSFRSLSRRYVSAPSHPGKINGLSTIAHFLIFASPPPGNSLACRHCQIIFADGVPQPAVRIYFQSTKSPITDIGGQKIESSNKHDFSSLSLVLTFVLISAVWTFHEF